MTPSPTIGHRNGEPVAGSGAFAETIAVVPINPAVRANTTPSTISIDLFDMSSPLFLNSPYRP
jgi:hypothetical protein